MNHLTDNQLQDILDGNIASSDPLMVHLDECPRCQEALAVYKSMAVELNTEIESGLSSNFADNVMAQLPPAVSTAEQKTAPRFVIRDRMVVFAAFAALLAAAIYFLKPATLLKAFGGLKLPADNTLFTTIGDYMSAMNLNPTMLVMAACTIIAIGLLDQIITRHRKRRGPVSFLV